MATVSGGTTSERFGFIQKYGHRVSVRYLCNYLGVSKSGYYDSLKRRRRPPSRREQEEAKLLKVIRWVHVKSRETYGSPRVHKTLQLLGYRVSTNRVARIMRKYKLRGRVTLVTKRQPGLKRFQKAGENLRLHQSVPQSINKQWVADITFIKVKKKWLHLITIMDVFSRRILGWSLCKSRTSESVLSLLRRVIAKRKPPQGLIFHTDRGVEFMAFSIQNELKKHRMLRSYNRLGHCTDNAHMESFYHSLKAELIRGRRFSNAQNLRGALNSYINQFYNHQRMHSGIGFQTPANYETMAA